MSRIQEIFDPKTIALIGATEKEGTLGRTILSDLIRSKKRKIFSVNPHTSKILDMESYPSIARVPEHMDLAIVVTPARTVPVVVEE
jgi:acetyltransferase